MKNLLEQLQNLATLAAAATAGPWRLASHPLGNLSRVVDMGRQTPPRAPFCVCHGDEAPQHANAAFIAAARNVFTPENLALLTAALAPASDEAELLRLCGRGIAAARTQVAITELIDTLKWLVPLVPKSKLDGDALEAIGGARFTGEELVTELRSKVSAIEKQVAELSAALVTVGRSPAND